MFLVVVETANVVTMRLSTVSAAFLLDALSSFGALSTMAESMLLRSRLRVTRHPKKLPKQDVVFM
jgi:hypothetical protein